MKEIKITEGVQENILMVFWTLITPHSEGKNELNLLYFEIFFKQRIGLVKQYNQKLCISLIKQRHTKSIGL